MSDPSDFEPPMPPEPVRVSLGQVEVRGIVLGGKKVSSQLHLRLGDSAYTVLVNAEAAKAIAPHLGYRVVLVAEIYEKKRLPGMEGS